MLKFYEGLNNISSSTIISTHSGKCFGKTKILNNTQTNRWTNQTIKAPSVASVYNLKKELKKFGCQTKLKQVISVYFIYSVECIIQIQFIKSTKIPRNTYQIYPSRAKSDHYMPYMCGVSSNSSNVNTTILHT